LCIFVLDHDPLNSEFGLRLKDFGWNPSSLGEFGRISIPLDSVGLRLQIRRYSISYRRFTFIYDLVGISWLIQEIGQREGGVDLQEVGLELLSAHHADGLCATGRWSARRLSAGSSSSSSCVLVRLSFDLFGRVLLVARSLADSP
jgi:hypothetical protein